MWCARRTPEIRVTSATQTCDRPSSSNVTEHVNQKRVNMVRQTHATCRHASIETVFLFHKSSDFTFDSIFFLQQKSHPPNYTNTPQVSKLSYLQEHYSVHYFMIKQLKIFHDKTTKNDNVFFTIPFMIRTFSGESSIGLNISSVLVDSRFL